MLSNAPEWVRDSMSKATLVDVTDHGGLNLCSGRATVGLKFPPKSSQVVTSHLEDDRAKTSLSVLTHVAALFMKACLAAEYKVDGVHHWPMTLSLRINSIPGATTPPFSVSVVQHHR